MKKAPIIWTLRQLVNHCSETQAEINGKWVPLRPIGLDNFVHRFMCAWRTFKGEVDIVIWPEGQ